MLSHVVILLSLEVDEAPVEKSDSEKLTKKDSEVMSYSPKATQSLAQSHRKLTTFISKTHISHIIYLLFQMIFIRIYVYDIYIHIDSIFLSKVQIPFMQFARIPLLKYRWVVWWNSMVSRAHPHQLLNISCYPHVSPMKSCK